jgi:hypothetical protein
MTESHIMVEVKIKDKILSTKDIQKAKKKLPRNYTTTDENPAIIIGRKSATIVFKCIKHEDAFGDIVKKKDKK